MQQDPSPITLHDVLMNADYILVFYLFIASILFIDVLYMPHFHCIQTKYTIIPEWFEVSV